VAHKYGFQCEVYYSATPLTDDAGPADLTWLHVVNVRDLTIHVPDDEYDKNVRENNGFHLTALTLTALSIDFGLLMDLDQASFVALRNAKLAKSEITLAVMTGDIATPGEVGWCANFVLPGWEENQPVAEGVVIDVTIKPGSYPQTYQVA
jgi:hypothetical protein